MHVNELGYLVEWVPALALTLRGLFGAERVLFKGGARFGFTGQRAGKVVGIIDAVIFVAFIATRPSDGLAMQVKPLALERPANDLDGPGIVPRAFPKAGNAKKDIFKRVPREFLGRSPVSHIGLPPPGELVGQMPIARRFALRAGVKPCLASGKNEERLRL